MPRTDAQSVATSCLDAWTTGDFAKTRALLADDVTFVGPLATTEGIDEYMRGIEGMAKIVERANVTRTAGWYLVRDGEITSVRAYFDPRPLTPSGGEDVNS
jgi:ketosteroid isomerase-like protein